MAGAARERDYAKWAFFVLTGLLTLWVIWFDERFLVVRSDPEWAHIQPFKWWLLAHAPFGALAFFIGPLQFSDTLRRRRPQLHRWLGRIYVGAIVVAASVALYIGPRFERPQIHVQQYFQAGGWLFTTLMALLCALKRNIPAHRSWMMKSYGFCLIFVLSRVPDGFPNFHWTGQLLADSLWGLVFAALIGPDAILTVRELARRRWTAARAA